MLMPDFSDLDVFVSQWGDPRAQERLRKRMGASMEELKSFHAAMVPRLEEIIDFLNQFPVDAIPDEYRPLAHAALAVCEVDDAVNLWGSPVLELASDPLGWRVKNSYYDYW